MGGGHVGKLASTGMGGGGGGLRKNTKLDCSFSEFIRGKGTTSKNQ